MQKTFLFIFISAILLACKHETKKEFVIDGKIKNARVEKGIGFGLDERAVAAVKRMGFAPAQLEGKEIDAQAQVVFDFKLQKVGVYIIGAELSGAPRGEKF